MGFKDKMYRQHHKGALKDLLSFTKIVKKVNKDQKRIQSVYFSDLVLGISHSAQKEDAQYLIAVFSHYFVHCLNEGIPIKGALAFGNLTANFKQNIFCGLPLIDAYQLGEDLMFYGIVLHHTFQKKLVSSNLLASLESEGWIFKHKVQFRSGGKATHYCINWLKVVLDHKLVEIEQKLDNFYITSSGRIRIYVDNTMEFYLQAQTLAKPKV